MDKFNVRKITNELIIWLKNWFLENGKDSLAVIGISGGKDSSIVAALCVKALGKDRVLGVMMPNGDQSDIYDAIRLCNILDIKNITVNIKDTFDTEKKLLLAELKKIGKDELTKQTLINLPARIRMVTLYGISQTVNGRVINTSNLSEIWIGYSTRFGDSVGDVSPLANFTVSEVKEIGLELGLPSDLVNKVPSDGLSGRTDEDNLGFTYNMLDKYIREGICEDENIKNLIDERHKNNEFKTKKIPSFEYGKVLIDK